MPRAQLLEKAFGDTSTVLDVVASVATVAQTLAALAEDGTYHRDIKPANIFWYDQAPVLADFHAELRAWLDRHASGTARFTPLKGRRIGRGWGPDLLDRHRRDAETTRAMMLPCIRRIAEASTGDASAWSEGIDHDSGGATLGEYRWTPNSEDGFVPDGGTLWRATALHRGGRIVLEAVPDHDVCFLAEAQRSGPPWTLDQQWGHTPWHPHRCSCVTDERRQPDSDRTARHRAPPARRRGRTTDL
ncbi:MULTISPECIES: hypothetical protein [unclassified Streptomyces]|uniref:hypothetical protein n=1 Tax=unclassified Streptomyces TaxID=2593676 RepID=UPI00339FB13A